MHGGHYRGFGREAVEILAMATGRRKPWEHELIPRTGGGSQRRRLSPSKTQQCSKNALARGGAHLSCTALYFITSWKGAK